MNIWVVTASSGQYDEWREWNVKAFSTEEAANGFIGNIGEINYQALNELEELRAVYEGYIDCADSMEWTDEQWNKYYIECDAMDMKALCEVQAKYPLADLSIDKDFCGYDIEVIELEETSE
jgi:hypothetical protein